MSNCPDYNKVSERNRVPFKTEAEAQAAGYRKAKNCPQLIKQSLFWRERPVNTLRRVNN
jgi:hypothetical protein